MLETASVIAKPRIGGCLRCPLFLATSVSLPFLLESTRYPDNIFHKATIPLKRQRIAAFGWTPGVELQVQLSLGFQGALRAVYQGTALHPAPEGVLAIGGAC